jgi:hypothetical protein
VLDVAGIPFDLELVVGVITASGEWPVGVQLAPDHVPPEWPDGAPQQVHLDLHVEDPRVAHVAAIGLGARLLQPGDFDAEQGHQVYADPAGHPFCIGWGHTLPEMRWRRWSRVGRAQGAPTRVGTDHVARRHASPNRCPSPLGLRSGRTVPDRRVGHATRSRAPAPGTRRVPGPTGKRRIAVRGAPPGPRPYQLTHRCPARSSTALEHSNA